MPAGRPTKMTKETIAKLEFAYSCNCNDTEACLYAEIADTTLDRYEEKHPEFRSRKAMLRSKPRMTSKIIQSGKLNEGCAKTAEFILVHTDDEYQTKQKQEHSGSIGMTLLEQIMDDEGEDDQTSNSK
jgi:hypothetical protein